MAFSVQCPGCGGILQVPPQLAGQSIACPGCRRNFTAVAGAEQGSPLAQHNPLQAGPTLGKRRAAVETPWYTNIWLYASLGMACLMVGTIVLIVMTSGEKSTAPAVAASSAALPVAVPVAPSPTALPKSNLSIAPIVPAALEQGLTLAMEIAVARNGQEGPLEIRAENLPAGVTAVAVQVAPDQSQGTLQLVAATEAPLVESGHPIKVAIATAPVAVAAASGTPTGSAVPAPAPVAGTELSSQQVLLTLKKAILPSFLPLASVSLKPGEKNTVSIGIERNGLTGPVEIQVTGLPDQVVATPATIPPEQSSIQLELSAPAALPESATAAKVTARIGQRLIESALQVNVENFPFRLVNLPVITIKPGATIKVDITLERRSHQGPIDLTVEGLPALVTVTPTTVPAGATTAKLEIKADTKAMDRVRTSRIGAMVGTSKVQDRMVVRVKSGDGSNLPPDLEQKDDRLNGLGKNRLFGGRLTTESKDALVDIYGGTPESEAAVLRGLKWLARHQSADGKWSLEAYHKASSSSSCDCILKFEEEIKAIDTAGTAFGLLPMLGAGITHKSSPSSPADFKSLEKNVERGLAYLIKNQAADGNLGGGMYAQAIGSMALSEAYGMTQDKELRVPAQKALRYLLEAQSPKTGGWGYSPKADGDTSVVGWVFLAIRGGQMAGIPPDEHTKELAEKFMNSTSAGPEGLKKSRYSYVPEGPPTIALTAAGLLTRQYLGWQPRQSELPAGCQFLMENLPPEAATQLGPSYYYYYATQVLHHMEGENWDRWNLRMREHLLRTQETGGHRNGSWSPEGADWGKNAGRLYSTSLSLLTLEVYYRHLPLYRTIKLPPAKPLAQGN